MVKHIFHLVCCFLLLSNISSFSQNKFQELKVKTSAVCDMCKETLEKAMAYERGVKSSNLDVESAILTVLYNSEKTSPEKIKKAISLVGYDADELQANEKAYNKLNACCKKDAHKK
jgi:cation transport ATPase